MKRTTANPHEYRRAVEDRVSKMPMADDRWHLTPEQKLESLHVCGVFATAAAWLVFNSAYAFWTGLAMTAICLTAQTVYWRGGR